MKWEDEQSAIYDAEYLRRDMAKRLHSGPVLLTEAEVREIKDHGFFINYATQERIVATLERAVSEIYCERIGPGVRPDETIWCGRCSRCRFLATYRKGGTP